MAFKLYELNAQYQQLIDLISNSDEERPEFTDTLESIEDAIEDKLENTAKVIRAIEAEANAIKVEEDRLKKRRQALEGNADRLKDYIFQTMQLTGRDKVKGAHVNLRLQYNPPSVQLLDEALIPARYLVEQPSTVDKKTLLQDLKNGVAVEGAELQRKQALRIV
jgi:hypothetical protein